MTPSLEETITREIRRELRQIGNELLETLQEEVASCILLEDAERLGRLVAIIRLHMDAEVVRAIRSRGLEKELDELCRRAGGERGT